MNRKKYKVSKQTQWNVDNKVMRHRVMLNMFKELIGVAKSFDRELETIKKQVEKYITIGNCPAWFQKL